MKFLLVILAICITAISGMAQQIESNSLNQFIIGKTKSFSSYGLAKAQGLNLNIKYPASWKSVEGERPYIVQKFVPESGYVMAMLLVNKLDGVPNQSEINDFYTQDGLKAMMPAESKLIAYNSSIKIERQPAGKIDYTTVAQRMNRHFYSCVRSYFIIYKDYLITLQFMVMNKIDEPNTSVDRRFKTIEPLFDMMANSIVFNNLYQN